MGSTGGTRMDRVPAGRGWSGCRRDADGQDAGGTRMVRMPTGRGWSGSRGDADGQDAGGTRMVQDAGGTPAVREFNLFRLKFDGLLEISLAFVVLTLVVAFVFT